MLELIQVEKQIRWEMGHRLSLHKGKCHNLHGHSYKAVVLVEAKGVDENGMVTDFYNYKPLKEWIDTNLDHSFMLNVNDPLKDQIVKMADEHEMKLALVNFEPTAENIAKMILTVAGNPLTSIADKCSDHVFRVRQVVVWETEDCCATYIDRSFNLPERH